MSRANKQIWRLAEYLYNQVRCYHCDNGNRWKTKMIREWWYDEAAELLKKLSNNEFTGEDNHE